MTTITIEEIWKQTCRELQQNMSPSTYNTWILTNPLTDFRLVGDDRAIGVITSPTAFHSTNVEKNFYAQIKEILDRVTGRNSELQFRIGEPIVQQKTISFGNESAVENSSEVHSQTYQPSQPASFIQQTQHPPIQDSIQNSPQDVVNSIRPEMPVIQAAPQPPSMSPLSPTISSFQERLKQFAKADNFEQVQQPQSLTHQSNQSGQSHQFNQSFQPSQKNSDLGLFSPSTLQTMTVDRARLQAQKAGLRLDYTFDTFAVSTTNEMAHAAALAVSDQPGTAYNPLFIYGGVGVGKTHLMHAVGNNILKNNPEVKILYCTGEDFTNDIVGAIQNKKAILFKEKYRNVDVLLIDDVQFIAGKNTVQEEFFHTFNTITKRSGQVIMTSDQPPHEISLLEDRLRSRFEAGLMVDIQQPSFELRTAILLIKANSYHLQIPMNLAQIIASKVDSARKIEGIMKIIKSEVELKHREISQELIDEIFKADTDKAKQKIRVKPYDIIKTVADFYHLKQVTIRGTQRVQSIVKARHIAMFFLKEELQTPYVEIGRWFSNRDHTSAMHAVRKVNAEIGENEEMRQELAAIRSMLVKISK